MNNTFHQGQLANKPRFDYELFKFDQLFGKQFE